MNIHPNDSFEVMSIDTFNLAWGVAYPIKEFHSFF